jgi:phosphoribosylglycinamide formyltransferase 2
LERVGASAVILAEENGRAPIYSGMENVLNEPNSDVRIFNKPTTRPYRRMAVVLTYDKIGSEVDKVKNKAISLSKMMTVEPTEPL